MSDEEAIRTHVYEKDGWWHAELEHPRTFAPLRVKFLKEDQARSMAERWLAVALGTGKEAPTYTKDDVRSRAAGTVRRKVGRNFTGKKNQSEFR